MICDLLFGDSNLRLEIQIRDESFKSDDDTQSKIKTMSPRQTPKKEDAGQEVRKRVAACRKRLRTVRTMRRSKIQDGKDVELTRHDVVLEKPEGLRSRLATNILIDMEAGVCWLEARFATEVDRSRFRVQD